MSINDEQLSIPVATPQTSSPWSSSSSIKSLAWKHISYYYRTKKAHEKAAIKDCTGLVKRGDMVAVMGPSGAGKSSLFDVLARRIGKTGRLEGDIYINGSKMDDKNFLRISEYVQNEDIFVPTQTLIQALKYHCNLRLGSSIAYEEKLKRIDTLLQEAGLHEKQQSRIGGLLPGGITVKGLSTGEKRRLSIICAALANSPILFLDEPTTGLDSYTALRVMEMMAKLCHKGRILVTVIHQPRYQVYELFNKILILSEGRSVYFGNPLAVTDWFDSKLQRPFPRGISIPDFIVDTVNVSFLPNVNDQKSSGSGGLVAASSKNNNKQHNDASSREIRSKSTLSTSSSPPYKRNTTTTVDVEKAAAILIASEEYKKLVDEIDEIIRGSDDSSELKLLEGKSESNWWYKFRIVFGRNLRHYLANPGNVWIRLMTAVIVGVFQGVAFYHIPDKEPLLIKSFSFLICLFVTQIQALLLPFLSMTIFIEDRKFFIRESASRLYPTSVYFLANALLEIIFTTINAIIYGSLTYFLCFYSSQPEGEFAYDPRKFIVYLAFVIFTNHAGSMQAITCSILSPNLEIACAINVCLTAIFCFGGISPALLESKAKFIQWLSPLRYGYTATVMSTFRGTAGMVYVDMVQISSSKPSGVADNLLCLFAFFVLFNLISYFALHHLYRNKT